MYKLYTQLQHSEMISQKKIKLKTVPFQEDALVLQRILGSLYKNEDRKLVMVEHDCDSSIEEEGRSSRSTSAILQVQGQRGEILSQTSSSTNKKKLKAGITVSARFLKLTKLLRFETKQIHPKG